MNFTSGAEVSELLSLDTIRSQLIRLEDTIIFCQCSHLATTHRPGLEQLPHTFKACSL